MHAVAWTLADVGLASNHDSRTQMSTQMSYVSVETAIHERLIRIARCRVGGGHGVLAWSVAGPVVCTHLKRRQHESPGSRCWQTADRQNCGRPQSRRSSAPTGRNSCAVLLQRGNPLVSSLKVKVSESDELLRTASHSSLPQWSSENLTESPTFTAPGYRVGPTTRPNVMPAARNSSSCECA
jgi:hypothetical protein